MTTRRKSRRRKRTAAATSAVPPSIGDLYNITTKDGKTVDAYLVVGPDVQETFYIRVTDGFGPGQTLTLEDNTFNELYHLKNYSAENLTKIESEVVIEYNEAASCNMTFDQELLLNTISNF